MRCAAVGVAGCCLGAGRRWHQGGGGQPRSVGHVAAVCVAGAPLPRVWLGYVAVACSWAIDVATTGSWVTWHPTTGSHVQPSGLGLTRRAPCTGFWYKHTWQDAPGGAECSDIPTLSTTSAYDPACPAAAGCPPLRPLHACRCVGVCRNPQNVPGPLVFPHEMQTAEDAVRLQLNALRDNHVPRFNHGIQVGTDLGRLCVRACVHVWGGRCGTPAGKGRGAGGLAGWHVQDKVVWWLQVCGCGDTQVPPSARARCDHLRQLVDTQPWWGTGLS